MTIQEMRDEVQVVSVNRSLRVDLVLPQEIRQSVIDGIRLYRACCRQCYSVLLLAQTCGGVIEDHPEKGIRIREQNKISKAILALAMRKRGKALAYELRNYVLRELWPS